ncbi:MAG: hypothetical protein AB6733_24440 [Clostridiaceae bacterium]
MNNKISNIGNKRSGKIKLNWVIILSGAVLAISFLAFNLLSISNSIKRIELKKTATLDLKETGEYTIFYEYYDEEELNYLNIKNLNIRLSNKDTNKDVILTKNYSNSNYSFGERSGKSIYKFSIDTPGVYEISALNYSGESDNLTFGIINKFSSKLWTSILGFLLISFGSGSIVIFRIIKARLRSNLR